MITLRPLLALFAAGALCACDDETASPPTDYMPLLRAATEGVILPANSAFSSRADELATLTRSLHDAPSSDALAKAQQAWRAARSAYRSLDAAHFGPVVDRGTAGRIDLTPASPADIDAIVAGSGTIDAASVAAASGKTKGFLGLEYFFFSPDGDEAALASLDGDDTTAVRRRALASAIASDIAATAHQVDDAWSPSKGRYADEVLGAGTTSQRYATQRAAVDDLVGGVGYALELLVAVDLATPLGLKSDGSPDPSRIVTLRSENGTADMRATAASVQAAYGSFADQVKARSNALDDRTQSEIADCTNKIAAITTPFSQILVDNPTVVRDAYSACKVLKATWNVEVTSALGATLKPTDNDGD